MVKKEKERESGVKASGLTMVNKTDVSNQITGLRPKVKQAAVYMAHHHTREIKKYEVRKGPKAQKFRNKAENLKKEFNFLKNIHPDNVSRFALSMDFKDREKLLSDVNLPLETKVIIKLATQKPVVSQIEEFRKSHPEWKSTVPQILESLGIRTKFKKKIQKEQEKQARKLARRQELSQTSKSVSPEATSKDDNCELVVTDDNQLLKTSTKIPLFQAEPVGDVSADSDSDEMSVASNDEGNNHDNHSSNEDDSSFEDGHEVDKHDNHSSDENDSSIEDGHEVDNQDDHSSNEDDSSIEDDHETISSSESNSQLDDAEENDNRIIPTHLKNSSKQKRTTVPHISSGSKLAEVRRFADFLKEAEQDERKPRNKSSLEIDDQEESELSENEPVEEDTFFMTNENRFLKTVAVKRENGEGLNAVSKKLDGSTDKNTSPWALDGKNLKGNRAQRRAKFLGKDPRKLQVKVRKNKELNNITNTKQSNSDKDITKRAPKNLNSSTKKYDHPANQRGMDKSIGFKKQVSNPMQSDSGESLHPSWAAKRKQNVSLASFQGKKITFDD